MKKLTDYQPGDRVQIRGFNNTWREATVRGVHRYTDRDGRHMDTSYLIAKIDGYRGETYVYDPKNILPARQEALGL